MGEYKITVEVEGLEELELLLERNAELSRELVKNVCEIRSELRNINVKINQSQAATND